MLQIPEYAFSLPVEVTTADIDELNHVNNVVYLRWIQEVATAHWMSVTTPEEREPWGWVVRRHEIDYLRPCFLGDELKAYTWVIPTEGMGSDRVVVLMNQKTGKPIMQSKTTWYLVDMATMRSRSIPEELLAPFMPEDPAE